jgi:hypothetical protein
VDIPAAEDEVATRLEFVVSKRRHIIFMDRDEFLNFLTNPRASCLIFASIVQRRSQMMTSRFSYPLICDVPFGGWLALPSQWIRLRVSYFDSLARYPVL